MLKRYSLKKIILSLCSLFTLLLIYLIPKEPNLNLTVKQEIKYVYESENKSDIYLLDSYNYVAMTNIINNEEDIEAKARVLLETLIIGGESENNLPSGFKAIIPEGTKIIDINYKEGIIKINFSKELLDVQLELEEKMIEAIVYTMTSISDINKVIIYVDGNVLTRLPKTKINLPSALDRKFGINKEYDITSTHNINNINIYYINKYNDEYYYVPVTKYVNDDREKIDIVIENMCSNLLSNTNLMSFLNSNARLLAVENSNDALILTFNSYLFNDLDTRNILEEVTETIKLSVMDNYDVKEVILKYDEDEFYESVIKTIE